MNMYVSRLPTVGCASVTAGNVVALNVWPLAVHGRLTKHGKKRQIFSTSLFLGSLFCAPKICLVFVEQYLVYI